MGSLFFIFFLFFETEKDLWAVITNLFAVNSKQSDISYN